MMNTNTGWLKLLRLLRRDSGSALVETALTLPVIIAMLLGAVELGDFAFRATEVTNAARAAAQYAAMNGGNFDDCSPDANGNCAAGSGIVAAAKHDAPRTTATCTNFNVQSTTSCACSTDGSACTSGAGAYTCGSGTGDPLVTVSVATSAQCAPIASIPGLFSGAFTLHGGAQQEVLK
jgi:Flp pilus assembly protein TadG